MQKAIESNSTRQATFVSITPRQLRAIADRMESDHKSVKNLTGQKKQITYDVTQDITFYFDPSLSAANDAPVITTEVQTSNADIPA